MVREVTALKIPYLAFPALLVSALAVLVGQFLDQENFSYKEMTEQQLAKYDRLRSIAAFKIIVSQNSSVSEGDLGAQLFFAGGTPAIVTAQLLTNLKIIAAAHGLEILRAADLPAKTEGSLNLIAGTLDLSGNMANVFALVQDIESAKPALFIEKLDMHSNSTGAADPNADTFLTVSIQVSGAMQAQIDTKLPSGN